MKDGGKVLNHALGHVSKDGADPGELDWDDFRVFTVVAREGSYTRGARKLSITQSAVSRRIARLEKALGARLFDRVPQGVQLTSEGTRLIKFANGAEMMLARAVGSVREGVRRVDGDCKLIMGDGVATYWMPPFLNAFFDNNSSINLKIFTSPELGSSQTPPYDIQIQYTLPVEVERVAIRVATAHFELFAAPEYVLRFGIPKTSQELGDHRVADSAVRLAERGSLASWANLDHDAVIMTNSSGALCEAVRVGSVIGLLPSYLPIIDPRLVPILPDMVYSVPIFLCFERETGGKPAVRATIDYLKEFVFDRQRMPWFFERFVAPQKEWKRIYDSCLERAADNQAPHIATGS